LFGSKKNHRDAEGLAAPEESALEPTSREAGNGTSPQREAWRRAAQSVTRTWSEWSAADGRRRSELYSRYISALDEEEQAAAALQEQAAAALQQLQSDDPRVPSVPGSCR
jgi:hypothetical protein